LSDLVATSLGFPPTAALKPAEATGTAFDPFE
jgi:hypothetical protein